MPPIHRICTTIVLMNLSSRRLGLHQTTVETIGASIVNGTYQPGDRLAAQGQLAYELGVSRTVIREAIRLLTDKGLVESRPKVGTTVTQRSDWNFGDADVLRWALATPHYDMQRHLDEVRLMIGPAAAGLAAHRRSSEHIASMASALRDMEASIDNYPTYVEANLRFHQAILDAAANPVLNHILNSVQFASREVGQHTALDVPETTLPLQADICDAIQSGDASTATSAMKSLLRISVQVRT